MLELPDVPHVNHRNDRVLADDYTGDVLLWDIDKTYLNTHFSSLRGLLAIPFEFAVDKETIPGSVPLLRALRRGAEARSQLVPLFFVSGSPPQLRRVIERRMTLDGVEFDGVTFKDQLGLVLGGRPRGVVEQLGYKLKALLLYRRRVPAAARWLMFGDDVESDAEVFGLFGRICAGLRGAELAAELEAGGVHQADADWIARLASDLVVTPDPVERIFIYLSGGRDPASFPDQPRVVPARNYLQTALVLREMGRITDEALVAVLRELRRRHVPEHQLAESRRDAVSRLGVSPAVAELVAAA